MSISLDAAAVDLIWSSSPRLADQHAGVTGYEPIDIKFTARSWGGLEYNGNRALMDGSVSADGSVSQWWYAVGGDNNADGLTGPGTVEYHVELYVFAPPTYCGCPALPDVAGAPGWGAPMSIAYSNGLTIPTTARYTCVGIPATCSPQGGDATRQCGADGLWSGSAPTDCPIAAHANISLAMCRALGGDNTVEYDGHVYRTLDGAPPNATGEIAGGLTLPGGIAGGHPNVYLPLPCGFQVAPNDPSSRAVIANYSWGTSAVFTAAVGEDSPDHMVRDGVMWGTAVRGPCATEPCAAPPGQCSNPGCTSGSHCQAGASMGCAGADLRCGSGGCGRGSWLQSDGPGALDAGACASGAACTYKPRMLAARVLARCP